jgi:hypothetical protein
MQVAEAVTHRSLAMNVQHIVESLTEMAVGSRMESTQTHCLTYKFGRTIHAPFKNSMVFTSKFTFAAVIWLIYSNYQWVVRADRKENIQRAKLRHSLYLLWSESAIRLCEYESRRRQGNDDGYHVQEIGVGVGPSTSYLRRNGR